MGSLKSKKKIHVSSVTYNLAGDIKNRSNFLQNVLLASVLAPETRYIGEDLTRACLGGQGIKFRQFSNWARNSGYTKDVIKQSNGTITLPANVDNSVIASYINPADPNRVLISLAELGIAEYNYWAMQYMFNNHPEMIEGNWLSSFDDETGEVVIHFYDSGSGEATETHQERFIPVDYIKDARYVYATYMESTDTKEGVIEEGSIENHGTNPPPSTVGWENLSTTNRTESYDTSTTIHTLIEYSDSTPPEEDTDTVPDSVTVSEQDSVWVKDTYIGSLPDQDSLGSRKEFLNLFQTHEVVETVNQTVTEEDLGDGVIKTTTVTTTTRTVELNNLSRKDIQINIPAGWSTTKLLIYREGSGDLAMDSQFKDPQDLGNFFPFIPVRLWNRFISDSYIAELFEPSKKAVKRSIGGSFKKIQDSIADNPSLGDIDHAFITFGVPLNTKDNSSKRYIYNFFQQLLEGYTNYDYQVWEENFLEAVEKQAIWREWRQAQWDQKDPLYGTPEPDFVEIPYAPAMSIRIKSNHSQIDYDMTVSWSSMVEEFFVGQFKPGAKRNEIDISLGVNTEDSLIFYTANGTQQVAVDWRDPVRITWQYENDKYRRLTIRGLNHRNIVYKGKSVNITGREAMNDTDESGFLIPIQVQLYKDLPLVHSTQMTQACAYIVFNSWKETKQKWYQTGAFKIIVVVAVVIVTVATGGFGAASAGVLGTNASVGAAIGFTGTAAIVAGAIANAIAAIVIAQTITWGATKLFGQKWGTIIGTIAALVTLNMATSYSTGGGWAVNYAELTKPTTLMKLTAGIGKGIAHEIQMKAMKKLEEAEALIADYEKQSKEIALLYEKNIGNGTGVDLLAIQEIASKFDFNAERPTDFLTRTLMTGTDIAELSQTLIDEFANITTDLSLT